MSRVIGIGVIGTGFARRVQIPAFLRCEGVRVASVASHNIDNAKATADESAAGHFTDDWRETVAHNDVDLICITTPPYLHREQTLAAIANGKNVLCEKPMAMNVAEAEEMAAAARNSGKLMLIDHELRFQPGRRVARQFIRDGKLGNIRNVKHIFQAPHRGDASLPWNWWSDAKAGGGALGAIASHVIDGFRWLLDTEISSVSCQLQSHIKQRTDPNGDVRDVTSDDETLMMLRLNRCAAAKDATGIVSISMCEHPNYVSRFEIYGERGTLLIDHNGGLRFAAAGSEFSSIDVDLGANIDGLPDTGFARAFVSFAPFIVDGIRSDASSIEDAATFDDGVMIQRVIDAARLSDAEHRTVFL